MNCSSSKKMQQMCKVLTEFIIKMSCFSFLFLPLQIIADFCFNSPPQEASNTVKCLQEKPVTFDESQVQFAHSKHARL